MAVHRPHSHTSTASAGRCQVNIGGLLRENIDSRVVGYFRDDNNSLTKGKVIFSNERINIVWNWELTYLVFNQ